MWTKKGYIQGFDTLPHCLGKNLLSKSEGDRTPIGPGESSSDMTSRLALLVSSWSPQIYESQILSLMAPWKKTQLTTLWWTNIAMENGRLYWIFPLKMVIFHCYVSSPEGNQLAGQLSLPRLPWLQASNWGSSMSNPSLWTSADHADHQEISPEKSCQWPFQEPIDWRYLPYIRPKFQGISPQTMPLNMVLTYLHLLDPGFPIDHGEAFPGLDEEKSACHAEILFMQKIRCPVDILFIQWIQPAWGTFAELGHIHKLIPKWLKYHRIGWWENFNRKPLYLMVKTMVSG